MIFRFKVTFPDRPYFVREYDVPSELSLYDFHRFMQNDLDYDEAQPVYFYTATAKWEAQRSFALFSSPGYALMDEVSVGSLVRDQQHRLLYTFDAINDRSLRLELAEMLEREPRARYPRTASESGDAPAQIFTRVDSPLSSIFDQAMPDFDADMYASASGGGEE